MQTVPSTSKSEGDNDRMTATAKRISRPGFEPGTVRILFLCLESNNYNLTLYQLSYREYQKVIVTRVFFGLLIKV